MASEEHLAMLQQGAEVSNRWKRKSLLTKPDLIGADLQGGRVMHMFVTGTCDPNLCPDTRNVSIGFGQSDG